MSTKHSKISEGDTDRMNWLELEGLDRIVITKVNNKFELQIRLNEGLYPEHPWRYSERFTDFRAACDFGMKNQMVTP